MNKIETCTPAERLFLDTLKNTINEYPAWGSWWAAFNGILPGEDKIKLRSALVELLVEDGRPAANDIVDWLKWLAVEQGYDHA